MITDIIITTFVLIFTIVLSHKKLLYGLLFYFSLMAFAHKELFSLLNIWDLLPIRIAFVGLLLVSLYKISIYIKNNTSSLAKLIKEHLLNDLVLVLLLFLWIIRGVSLLVSDSMQDSIKLYIYFTSVFITYLIFKYIYIKNSKQIVYKGINVFLNLGIITSVFAVVQYILRICCRFTIGGAWIIPGYTPRLGSTFWDVNHYGGFLVIILPLVFTFILISSRSYQKVFYMFLSVLFLFSLLMTQSRSAFLGFVVGVLITTILYYLQGFKKLVIVIAVVGLLSLISVFIYSEVRNISIPEKVASYMHHRLDSTDTHVYLLEGAGEIFVKNMFIGGGYGNFDKAFRKTEISQEYFDREPKLKNQKVPSHSVWGEVLAETGGIGIFLYSALIIYILSSLITSIYCSYNKKQKLLGIGLLTSFVSIIVTGVFYSYNLEFYWFILFLCVAHVYYVLGHNYNISYLMNWWYENKSSGLLIILPITVFAIFINLGETTLIDWDEAIYAKVAKNIVLTGEWMSLRWDSMDKYWFEKPPLYMWLTSLVFYITNFNSFGARFVSALFSVFTIVLTYVFSRKLYNRLSGIIAALILLSTVHFLYYSRNGMLDVTLTFFILSSVYFYYLSISNDKKIVYKGYNLSFSIIYSLISGLCIGLAVMTKAIVGILPLMIILFYTIYLIYKRKKIKLSNFALILFSFVVVVSPWHLYSYIVHNGEFLKVYFIDHILDRGLSGLGHERPLLWFFEVVKVSFRIWLLPLVGGLAILPLVDKKKLELSILTISSVTIFVFFSISTDKLQWYIIPIYPFLAIISSRFLEYIVSNWNNIVRVQYRFNDRYIRFVSVIVLLTFVSFYIVSIRDRVYYPDFNKDKVALIKINNGRYPIDKYSDRKLYYNKLSPPVLLFYSDHKIKAVDEDTILNLVDGARPNETFTFITSDSMYYKVVKMQDKISAPLVLEIKGSAGGWVLYDSKSRVELLNDELRILLANIDKLSKIKVTRDFTNLEKQQYDDYWNKYYIVIDKLTGYGYEPFK